MNILSSLGVPYKLRNKPITIKAGVVKQMTKKEIKERALASAKSALEGKSRTKQKEIRRKQKRTERANYIVT